MTGWKNDLIDLFDFAFLRLRTRLEGLSDDEYFWEPAPGCWTIRANGHGAFHGDWADPAWPPPLTTIAWRLGHIINNLFDPRYPSHLGVAATASPPDSLPATAAEAITALEAGGRVTRGYLEAVEEASLGEQLGAVAGPWAQDDRGAFVLHMLDELIHHGAEVAVLRDLYRAGQPANPLIDPLLDGDADTARQLVDTDPGLLARTRAQRADLMIQAAAQQRWAALPVLINLDFPHTLADGTSALHHAAAAGDINAIQLLVQAGADPGRRDGLFRATAAEWADYFHHSDAANHLRQPTP